MDEVGYIALDRVKRLAAYGIPLAGQRADGLIDKIHGCIVGGLNQSAQFLIVGQDIVSQVDEGALAKGEGPVAVEGDGGLGQTAGAAVDTGDALAVLVLQGAGAHGVVMTGDDHVNAIGVGNKVGQLALHVEAVGRALAAVGSHNDNVTLLFFQLRLPLVLPLPGVGAVRVAVAPELHALIVGCHIPVGHVHVLKAKHGNFEGLFPRLELLDYIGDIRVRDLACLAVQQVGAHGGHRCAGHIPISGGGQHVIEVLLYRHGIVELVVAGDKHIVPAVAQAQRHRIVCAALHIYVVAGDGGALNGVAIVNQDSAVHGGPLLSHGRGYL